MSDNPLNSLAQYSRFLADLLHRTTVEQSTVSVWSDSPYTGVAEGEVFFSDIKHNRISAPEMSFTRPNLPVIIREIEKLSKA